MSPNISRISWGEEDTKKLISLWGRTGSVYIIAILLNRSMSSIQTQASRLNLPQRQEEPGHQRRRWTQEEDDYLIEITNQKTGHIDVPEIAKKLKRGVDATFSRLEKFAQDAAALRRRIYVPSVINTISIDAYLPNRGNLDTSGVVPKNNDEKMRNCLDCGKPFWSEGKHNKICSNCKRRDDYYDLF